MAKNQEDNNIYLEAYSTGASTLAQWETWIPPSEREPIPEFIDQWQSNQIYEKVLPSSYPKNQIEAMVEEISSNPSCSPETSRNFYDDTLSHDSMHFMKINYPEHPAKVMMTTGEIRSFVKGLPDLDQKTRDIQLAQIDGIAFSRMQEQQHLHRNSTSEEQIHFESALFQFRAKQESGQPAHISEIHDKYKDLVSERVGVPWAVRYKDGSNVLKMEQVKVKNPEFIDNPLGYRRKQQDQEVRTTPVTTEFNAIAQKSTELMKDIPEGSPGKNAFQNATTKLEVEPKLDQFVDRGNSILKHEQEQNIPYTSDIKTLISSRIGAMRQEHAPDVQPQAQKPIQQSVVAQEASAIGNTDKAKIIPRPGDESMTVGTLIKHGEDHYKFDKTKKSKSPYVQIEDDQGKVKTLWGVDFPRAIKEGGVQVGDRVAAQNLGNKTVEVVDENGKTIQAERNTWKMDKRSLQEDLNYNQPKPEVRKHEAPAQKKVQSVDDDGMKKPDMTKLTPEAQAVVDRVNADETKKKFKAVIKQANDNSDFMHRFGKQNIDQQYAVRDFLKYTKNNETHALSRHENKSTGELLKETIGTDAGKKLGQDFIVSSKVERTKDIAQDALNNAYKGLDMEDPVNRTRKEVEQTLFHYREEQFKHDNLVHSMRQRDPVGAQQLEKKDWSKNIRSTLVEKYDAYKSAVVSKLNVELGQEQPKQAKSQDHKQAPKPVQFDNVAKKQEHSPQVQGQTDSRPNSQKIRDNLAKAGKTWVESDSKDFAQKPISKQAKPDSENDSFLEMSRKRLSEAYKKAKQSIGMNIE